MKNIIRVRDTYGNKLAYLENAYDIGYDLTLNELWTATFTLPADDPKNIYCEPFNYVEIYDGDVRIELFRIMPNELTRSATGSIKYECEHVLATLLDSVMFKYHQIGNVGVYTTDVLRYILDQQKTTPGVPSGFQWVLGKCDFDRQFEYKWENENLLSALFSVPAPFNEGYKWTFNTKVAWRMWTINLERLDEEPKAEVMYRKNLKEFTKTVDPTSIVTRLYCLGYGEGDNQLTIESAMVKNHLGEDEPYGRPYLQDLNAMSTWGLKESILVDRRFESPETLMGYGERMLEELSKPFYSYSISAVDLYRLSRFKYERFMPGDIVRLIDHEEGISELFPIISVSKDDIIGAPGDITIEIGNKSRNIAGSISNLQERTRINETYAQGATNQMIIPYADNADAEHPALLRVYIPDTMVRINKLILNFQLEPFRAFSKAAAYGGAVTGTAVVKTTEPQNIENVDYWVSPQIEWEKLDPNYTPSWWYWKTGHVPAGERIFNYYTYPFFVVTGETAYPAVVEHDGTLHTHGLPSHGHKVMPLGDGHVHDITIPGLSVPKHTHDLTFGIHQETETPTEVSIKVDGNIIPISTELGGEDSPEGKDIDIVQYLATDNSGRIQRNTWHTIEIIPNNLTRIVANIFVQLFTNSRGGGDY